jgi:translation initiation factor IF-3
MQTREAIAKAKSMGLDLVEVASKADPPVCRIVDYGKFKYEQAKKKKEGPQKKKQKLKEIKFRVRIEEHDYHFKLAHAEEFLDAGDKLRIQLQFRGRENAHRELGFVLMERVKKDLVEMAHVDLEPRLAGRNITMMMSPLPDKQRKPKFYQRPSEEERETEDGEVSAAEAAEAADAAAIDAEDAAEVDETETEVTPEAPAAKEETAAPAKESPEKAKA